VPLKTHLRATMARTRDALERAIAAGLDAMIADDAHGWFLWLRLRLAEAITMKTALNARGASD